jgi:alpha-tubulin suppressor-like RCC1 family protein
MIFREKTPKNVQKWFCCYTFDILKQGKHSSAFFWLRHTYHRVCVVVAYVRRNVMKRLLAGVLSVLVIVACVLVSAPAVRNQAVSAAPRASKSKQISLGGDHSCALLTTGVLKCWGANSNGQLGLGNTNDYGDNASEVGTGLPAVNVNQTVKYVSAGYNHTCAIRNDNSTVCWGNNSLGELGIGNTNTIGDGSGEMGSKLVAVNLGTSYAKALSAGLEFTCALLATSQVKCWGDNTYGQLGVSGTHGSTSGTMGTNLPAIDFGTGRTAKAISTGREHACAILDNNTVKCWGANTYGQLGTGDTISVLYPVLATNPVVDLGTGRTAKAIAVGAYHTCAILDNGTLKCWGYNVMGQLGTDSTSTLGDGSGEMGDALLPINLGTGRTAKAIAASKRGDRDYTCAVLDNGTLKCWGANDLGQLGQGDIEYRGDQSGEMAALTAVDLGTGMTITAVAMGAAHNCVLLTSTNIKCFGHANNGKLGLGTDMYYGAAPGSMGDTLPILNLDGVALTPTASKTRTKTATKTRTRTKTRTATRTLTRSKTPSATRTATSGPVTP